MSKTFSIGARIDEDDREKLSALCEKFAQDDSGMIRFLIRQGYSHFMQISMTDNAHVQTGVELQKAEA